MPNITIKSAIVAVLQDNTSPMAAQDIFDDICRRKLYEFKAKDALAVVRSTLRRNCSNINLPHSRSDKVFLITDDGRFTLS